MSRREIAVLTVGRSDFTRYRPVLRALRVAPDVTLRLLVSGNHFSPTFGETWRDIAASGFTFEAGLEMTLAGDTEAAVGKAISLGTAALAQAFAARRPDLLVVLGDRYEMLCGPLAALGFMIPVAHLHGGAVTEGAIDEQVRHALTKMSHLHLTAIDSYAARIRQMGEEAWRVHVVGVPALDDILDAATLTREEASAAVGLDLTQPTLLVSFHPTTLEVDRIEAQTRELIAALQACGLQAVITYPNADRGHAVIVAAIEALAAGDGRFRLVRNAGNALYGSLMRYCRAIVGNSSSGLVEAGSFRLPAVNIGRRQEGKLKPPHVIDCPHHAEAIAAALARALSDEFRAGIASMCNPYGDGTAGPRAARVLIETPLDRRLLVKKFVDHLP